MIVRGLAKPDAERGTAFVTALVLLFAFTAGAVTWLARDVDRRVSNRSVAQSVAFQAARAGAQQVDLGSIRATSADLTIDGAAAERAAVGAAQQLFDSYGIDGRVVAVVVDRSTATVDVTVIVSDPAGEVTGMGSARAMGGP